MSPSHHRYAQFQAAPQQLSPAGMNHRLQAMRVFFSTLQRRGYTVDGSYTPKLRLTWLPNEAFKTPDDIRAASQPNPRDIAEDIWFKLIWAACTLSKEHLDEASVHTYPLAYDRAASLVWVTAARRMDEIRRLSVGCVRREWVPEMRDDQGQQVEPAEELCYLRVPTNKMRVMRDKLRKVYPRKSTLCNPGHSAWHQTATTRPLTSAIQPCGPKARVKGILVCCIVRPSLSLCECNG